MLRDLILIGMIIGMLLWAGCSAQKNLECAIPSDCMNLAHAECAGNWECNTGKCSFGCTAAALTGNNETDEIGKQLNQVNADFSEQDLAYIDGLEKELKGLTW